jgi:hypothetical protein
MGIYRVQLNKKKVHIRETLKERRQVNQRDDKCDTQSKERERTDRKAEAHR